MGQVQLKVAKVRCQTKKTILFGNFSQQWGGVFPNPKTFVNLPSIFLYAKLGPKWPQWSKTCYIDHLGSFWALLDRFGTPASLPCSAIFGPKRVILDPSAHMIEGWQWPKLLQTNLVYV